MRNCRTGPSEPTPIESPDSRPCASAVLRSIAISPLPPGTSPCTTLSGLKRRSAAGSTLNTAVPQLLSITFPSAPTSWASSITAPSAPSTSGSARTLASTEAE